MSFKCYKFGVLFCYVSDFSSWKWTVFLLLSTMEHSSCNLWRCCPERRKFQSFSGKFGSVTGTCSLTGTLIETNNMNHSIFLFIIIVVSFFSSSKKTINVLTLTVCPGFVQKLQNINVFFSLSAAWLVFGSIIYSGTIFTIVWCSWFGIIGRSIRSVAVGDLAFLFWQWK